MDDRWDAVDRKVLADVEKHGWSDMHVFPVPGQEGEPWNYSIGMLHTYKHPEICIVGMEQRQAHMVLWSAVDLIKKGVTLEPDTYVEQIIETFPMAIIEVDDILDDSYPLSMAYRFAEMFGPVTAVQLVWPDMSGHFPWQDEYDDNYRYQLLLGSWKGS